MPQWAQDTIFSVDSPASGDGSLAADASCGGDADGEFLLKYQRQPKYNSSANRTYFTSNSGATPLP
jgi:hypothetical protein